MNRKHIAHLTVLTYPFLMVLLMHPIFALWHPEGFSVSFEVYRFLLFFSSSVCAAIVLLASSAKLLKVRTPTLAWAMSAAAFAYFYIWPLVSKGWVVFITELEFAPLLNLLIAFVVLGIPIVVGFFFNRRANKSLQPTGYAGG